MNRFFMAAATAVALMASCSRISDVTRISGTVEDGIETVNIVVPAMDIDTVLNVTGGKFSLELPADETVIGGISGGQYSLQFVPDGTRISVNLSAEAAVESATNHVQTAFKALIDKSEAIQKDFSDKVKAIRADETLTAEEIDAKVNELYEKVSDEFVACNMEAVGNNSGNIVGLVALQNMNGMLEDNEVDSLVNTLTGKIRENEYVARLQSAIKARTATAEGKMFTDFTIEDSNGKTVKFSDFVGKGKYVLVDFWASWCGPCKREIPNIKAVYDKYKGKDFNVLSVAVWDRPEDTKASAKEHGVNWSQIINAQSVPTEIYGIEGIPHIMLIGPDGTILKRNLRGDDIEAAVSQYVKAKR